MATGRRIAAGPVRVHKLTSTQVRACMVRALQDRRARKAASGLITILKTSFARPVALLPKILRNVDLKTVQGLIPALRSKVDGMVSRRRRYRVVGADPSIHARRRDTIALAASQYNSIDFTPSAHRLPLIFQTVGYIPLRTRYERQPLAEVSRVGSLTTRPSSPFQFSPASVIYQVPFDDDGNPILPFWPDSDSDSSRDSSEEEEEDEEQEPGQQEKEDEVENIHTPHVAGEHSPVPTAAGRKFGTVLYSCDIPSTPASPCLPTPLCVDKIAEPSSATQRNSLSQSDFSGYEADLEDSGDESDGLPVTDSVRCPEDDPHYPGFDIYHDDEDEDRENVS